MVVSWSVLHPLAERVDAVDGALRVALEELLGALDADAGGDALGGRRHLGLDAVQLRPAPRVRLVEVGRGAGVDLHAERVAVAPDGVVGLGGRHVGLLEVAPEAGERLVRRRRARAQLGGEPLACHLRRVEVRQEPVEERGCAARAAPRRGLHRARGGLALRARRAALDARVEGAAVARHRLGHRGEAGGDVAPVLLGVARHQVEDATQRLRRAREHVDRAVVLTRGVELEREPQPLGHRVAGHAVAVVLDGRGLERGERLAFELRAGLVAVGREVGQLVLVAGDAHAGGGVGRERGVAHDVVISEVVDGGHERRTLLRRRWLVDGRGVLCGGGGGIRTHGDASATTVFKTAPINRSGTPPRSSVRRDRA